MKIEIMHANKSHKDFLIYANKVIDEVTELTSEIIENDLKKLSTLEEKLKSRIIGQDEAVEALCAAIRRSRVQISAVRKPVPPSEHLAMTFHEYFVL